MTASAVPVARRSATAEALAFYERVQPLVEQLDALASAWRDSASPEAWSAAVEMHNETMALAIRVDLRIARYRRGET